LKEGKALEWPEPSIELVARNHEMAILKTHLEKAIEGSGGTCLISGETGVGKTRLAIELLNYAKSRDAKVLYGRAVPHNITPYLVFTDALEEMFAIERTDVGSTRLKKITHAIRMASPEIMEAIPIIGTVMKAGAATAKQYKEFEPEPMAKKEKLLDSVAHLIRRISNSQPILVILDDLQWADPSSLGLLHYLARNVRSSRTLLVGIYCFEELEERVEGEPMLVDTLSLMRHEDLVEEIVLDRLNQSEVKALLNAALHGDPPNELVRSIYLETKGNPLFVLETAKLLVEDQILARVDGIWRLSKPAEKTGIPRKVREVITRRLAKLTATEREVLDCASVIGDPFESRVLENVLELDRTRLLRELDTIEKAYRLIHYGNGLYHFDHMIVQEVCYEGLNEELRKQYHLSVAKALETLYAPDPEPYESMLAHHYISAGVKDMALQHYIKAAESASHKYANEEAIFDLREALGLMEKDSVEKAYILEQLGELLQITGRFNDAVQNWREAISLHEKFDGKIPSAVLHRKIGTILGRSLGRVEEALREYKIAETLLTERLDDEQLAQLYQAYASLYAQSGDLEEAKKKSELAISLAESKNIAPILARCYTTLGTIILSTGKIDDGLGYLDKALQLALTEKLNDTAIRIYNNMGVTFEAQGEFLKASTYFEKGMELARKAGYLSQLSWLYDGLATTYLLQGKLEQALISAKSAVDLDRNQGQFRHLALALCSLGKLHCRLGQTKSARESFEEALMLAEQTGDQQAFVQSCIGLGDIALREQDFERARVILMRALELVERTGESRLSGMLFPVLADLYIKIHDVESSKAVLARLEDVAKQSKSPALEAVANRMWGKFYTLIEDWDKAFESFSSSLDSYRRIGQPHEQAETMVQLALAHAKRGAGDDLREAHQLLSRAIDIFESLHESEDAKRAETEKAKIQL
jgi:tetratricopeptide (TPR) repeat protein